MQIQYIILYKPSKEPQLMLNLEPVLISLFSAVEYEENKWFIT